MKKKACTHDSKMQSPFGKPVGKFIREPKEVRIMQRKQLLSIALISLVGILSCLSACASDIPLPEKQIEPSSEDLSMNDAIQIAQDAACQKRETTLTDLAGEVVKATFVLLENGQSAWVVTLFDDAFQDPTDVSVLISSPDGTILDIQTTNIGYFKTIRNRWQDKMGDAGTWPLEIQALFSRLYTLHDDRAVPDETMISQEKAASIALQELPAALQVDQILYGLSYNSSAQEEDAQYVWRISIVSEGVKRFQVNLSATSGTVLDVFDLSKGN